MTLIIQARTSGRNLYMGKLDAPIETVIAEINKVGGHVIEKEVYTNGVTVLTVMGTGRHPVKS